MNFKNVNKNILLDLYKRHNINGLDPYELNVLIDNLLHHDNIQEELLEIYLSIKENKKDHSELKSNASSGNWNNSIYQFGPSFPQVRDKVEYNIRVPNKNIPYNVISIVASHPHPFTLEWYKTNISSKDNISKFGDCFFDKRYLMIDILSEDSINNSVQILSENLGKGLIIYCIPRIINILNYNEKFINFCKENRDKIVVSSTNSDAFYNKTNFDKNGIEINNQMINWKTGVNFYTKNNQLCTYNNIWAKKDNKYHNLLNIFDKSGCEIDDHIEVKKNSVIKFLPHKDYLPNIDGKIYYDINLAQKIKSKYINLQFLQEGNSIHIYHVGDSLLGEDIELIEDFFEMKCKLIWGIFWIGRNRKFMNFWGDNNKKGIIIKKI